MNTRSSSPRIRWRPQVAVCWFLASVAMFAQGLPADELGDLLDRLDLKQLRATLIEQKLTGTVDFDEQARLRSELARLYVGQLEDFIESPEEFARVAKRLEDLESSVADLTRPEIRFQRLEARFRHGEYLLAQYREDRRRRELLVAIGRNFETVAEKFDALERECEKQIEKLETFDAGPDSLENLKADSTIEKLSDISYRSLYYAGWSFFHRGMARQDGKAARPEFIRALGFFCSFLDISPEDDIGTWDTDFLELGSMRNSQAFLGVALAFLAIGQNADADACLEILRSSAAPDTIREQLALWQIQTLLELGRLTDAVELAEPYLNNPNTLSELERGKIALMMIRFSQAMLTSGSPSTITATTRKTLNRISNLGLRTLAQLRQFTLVRKLMEDYEIQLTGNSFYLDWIRGQNLYQDAEKSGRTVDYLKAANQLNVAVRMGDSIAKTESSPIPVLDLERCRYHLGWAWYKGEDYPKAAECFEWVIARIARFDPKTAATAAWLQHDCYLRMADKQPEHFGRAIKILENLIARFPDSELAGKARLQIVKLRQTRMDAKDAVEKLKDVVKESPDPLSRYELCLAEYRNYLQLVSQGKDTTQAAKELRSLLAEMQPPAKGLSRPQILKLVLIRIDLMMRQDINRRTEIDQLVEQAVALAAGVENLSLLAELHYRQSRIAAHRKDDSAVAEHVRWLVENGDGTVYQKSVLVTRAQQLETRLRSNPTKGSKRSEILKELIDVYTKLAKSTGYNRESISTRKNSRVAISRLADLQLETGDNVSAEKNLELLVGAFPKNVSYLAKYARVLMANRRYNQALEIWRMLVRGLKKETEAWYEAKYNQIECLRLTNNPAAKQSLEQFLALYDPPADWQSRFKALAEKLGLTP